jgi:hypothetical protein
MAKKRKPEYTSQEIASLASDLLRNSKSKKVRRVAASDLTQARDKPKKAKAAPKRKRK